MAPSVLQNGGFVLGLIGAAALIAATAMNNWSAKDRQGEVVTSVYTYKGLWQDCETASSGLTECRPLTASWASQAVRALMIVGVVLGVLGAFISVFSLTCLTMNSMADTTKAKMSLTAGIMFIIGGVCGIAGASIYANQIVASFRISSMQGGYGGGMGGGNMQGGFGGGMGEGLPTYTFGPALFVAWIGGGVLVIGGILKSLAFKEMVKDEKPLYPGVAYKPQPRTKSDLGDYHSEGGKKDKDYV